MTDRRTTQHAFEGARRQQQDAARARFDAQATHRRANIEALHRSGGLAEINTAGELARRLDRITRYYAGEDLPASAAHVPTAALAPGEVIEAALERAAAGATEAAPPVARRAAAVAAEVIPGLQPATAAEQQASEVRAGIVLEKIIDTADFVGIRYLEQGVSASRAVCRVDIRDEAGRVVGYGTGSLVSPRLVLTNHHVLPSLEVARFSAVEFDYEDDVDGKPLQPQLLTLDPATFFFNDPERDFALVAVAAREEELAAYGLNRLIEAQGKAIVGDFVTVVQHPLGGKKQVALRENRIVDELELFLHYEADTEPGSSGSPVFNDQWEVVALHHASVPAGDRDGEKFLNEGIRASRILGRLAEQRFAPEQQALVDQLRKPERIVVPTAPAAISLADGGAPLNWSIPLELTIGLRRATAPPAEQRPVPTQALDEAPGPDTSPGTVVEALVEPFHDDDLSGRRGYDRKFLGIDVPLPRVIDRSLVSRLDDGTHVLPYEHFSIVVAKDRRLALFTASNVDASPERKQPEPGRDYTRSGLTGLGQNAQEKWFIDPRIPALHQLPDRFFTKDRAAFDKGHIVRREDVAWGDSFDELRRANGDTYHVSNCSPQVASFNRSNKKGAWGELENIVLKQAASERYCVFAGPVFRATDPIFHGVDESGATRVAIPREFWKIVVARSGRELRTYAFLLDQDLSDTPFEFAVDTEWRTRMVSIAALERLVRGVKFPKALHNSDQIGTSEGEAVRAQSGIERLSQRKPAASHAPDR